MITSFVSPRLLMMGGGSIGQAAAVLAQLGLSRPLVVTDPWMVSSGTVEKLLAPLKAAGITYGVFSDTVPDPTDTVIATGVTAMQASDYDCLIGVGGGSPMDTAKAMTILAAAPGGKQEISYGVPGIRFPNGGRIHFGTRRGGLSLYAGYTYRLFTAELADFTIAGTTIHFTADHQGFFVGQEQTLARTRSRQARRQTCRTHNGRHDGMHFFVGRHPVKGLRPPAYFHWQAFGFDALRQ